jgi:hypothetical protein
MKALAGDVEYQRRFHEAFVKRRLHPSTELRVWEYAIGRPQERLELSGGLSINARLSAERALLENLDLAEIEVLAAESQALVDRATALAKSRQSEPDVIDVPPRRQLPEHRGD